MVNLLFGLRFEKGQVKLVVMLKKMDQNLANDWISWFATMQQHGKGKFVNSYFFTCLLVPALDF